MKLNDDLLETYVRTFYGYGNYGGPFWFVGMEEGMLGGYDEIVARLLFCENHGMAELLDFAMMSRATSTVGDRWIGENARIMPTWGRLIRLLLAAKGNSCSPQDVRCYQGTCLGRGQSDNCILELMPLPCKSLNEADWFYSDWSTLSYLRSRSSYMKEVLPGRIAHLRRSIRDHRPACVVFYGKRYLEHWKAVAADTDFEESGAFLFGEKDGTVLCVTPHPVARGLTNDAFERAGRELGRMRTGPSQAR